MTQRKEPTLSDLGLDQPVQPPSSKISISRLQQESEDEQPVAARIASEPPKKSKWALWLFLGVCAFALFIRAITGDVPAKGPADAGRAISETNQQQPSFGDALQVLVDEVDQRLNANIFGKVTTSGRSAKVIVESDYFAKLDAKSQRFAIETIAEQWKTKCYGKDIKFTSWNGQVVAEF